jgi:hypothetical protein
MNDMGSAAWDKTVAIAYGEERVIVRTVSAAMQLLTERWPDTSGPSYRRALSNCQAAIADEGLGRAARVAFVVAAMEAGLRFEVFEDELGVLDVEIASVAQQLAKEEQQDDPDEPDLLPEEPQMSRKEVRG